MLNRRKTLLALPGEFLLVVASLVLVSQPGGRRREAFPLVRDRKKAVLKVNVSLEKS